MQQYKQEILEQLDRLPLELQRRMLAFAQALVLSLPKGVPGKQLLHFAGILEADDVQAVTEAIEAGCEQVDVNDRRLSEDIVLDIGEDNRIVGIEILDASKHLNLERLLPVKYQVSQ